MGVIDSAVVFMAIYRLGQQDAKQMMLLPYIACRLVNAVMQ